MVLGATVGNGTGAGTKIIATMSAKGSLMLAVVVGERVGVDWKLLFLIFAVLFGLDFI